MRSDDGKGTPQLVHLRKSRSDGSVIMATVQPHRQHPHIAALMGGGWCLRRVEVWVEETNASH